MGQVSAKLRKATDCYFWYCPACEELHPLPFFGWSFDGNLEKPSFSPSFRHDWTWGDAIHKGGTHPRAPKGGKVNLICHYIVTNGRVTYCGDCTHTMRGTIDMPDLPPTYQDGHPDCQWTD